MKKIKEYPLAENLNHYFTKRITRYTYKNKEKALSDLFAPYKNCTHCPLGTQGRSQVVFGDGNAHAKLMFVGEGPGRDEDRLGKPFVGRAGQLLTKIIEALGIERTDVYISNVVKCRPPQNRTPLPNEAQTCTSLLLFKEIEIISPSIICTLGATASQALISSSLPLGKVRGNLHEAQDILILPTYHPAYLLRNPEAKKIVWADIQQIIPHL